MALRTVLTHRHMKKKLLIITAAVLLLAAGFAAYVTLSTFHGTPTRINIPEGSSKDAVQAIIKEALPGSYGRKVAMLWALSGGRTAHGSFLVEPGSKSLNVARKIRSGRQTPLRFTFNNVRTLQQLAAVASRTMEFSETDFLVACDSVLPPRGYRSAAEFPAAFLPAPYEFYWTASPEYFVGKLADSRDTFWTPERRKAAASMGLTPVEVATIASIAEEETAAADERATVARLYVNRLQRGMKLQADPTVKFAVGDFSLRRITGRHLGVQSPYNTYMHEGLPPGPIRIPSAATLRAVLTAPKHDWLYMCAKEDFSGRHNFASDGATHMANARRYRAALDRRGIK